MKVLTLSPSQFENECRRLSDKVRLEAGRPDLVVAIARGGVRVAEHFCGPWTGAVEVRLQRPSTKRKEGWALRALRMLPLPLCNWLRILESRWLGRKDSPERPAPCELPEKARRAMARQLEASLSQGKRRKPLIVVLDDAADSGRTLSAVEQGVAREFPQARVVTAVLAATRQAGSRVADIALWREDTLLRLPWAVDYPRKALRQ